MGCGDVGNELNALEYFVFGIQCNEHDAGNTLENEVVYDNTCDEHGTCNALKYVIVQDNVGNQHDAGNTLENEAEDNDYGADYG